MRVFGFDKSTVELSETRLSLFFASSQSGDVRGVFTTVRSPSGCDSFSDVIAAATNACGGGTVGDLEVGGFGASDEKSSFGMSGFGCSTLECGEGSLGEAGCDSPSKIRSESSEVADGVGAAELEGVGSFRQPSKLGPSFNRSNTSSGSWLTPPILVEFDDFDNDSFDLAGCCDWGT